MGATDIGALLQQIEINTRLTAKTILSQDEAATYLGISRRNLADRTRARTIPCFKQDTHYYYRKDELDAWMTATRVKTQAEISAEGTTHVVLHKMKTTAGARRKA